MNLSFIVIIKDFIEKQFVLTVAIICSEIILLKLAVISLNPNFNKKSTFHLNFAKAYSFQIDIICFYYTKYFAYIPNPSYLNY